MNTTKLLHCISSLQRGGAEEVVCSLIEALAYEYDQTVIYFHDGPHRERLEKQGILCIHIKGLIAPFDPVAFIRFMCVIQKIKPDVLHSALWLANLFARVAGTVLRIPVINSLHNTITRDHDGFTRIIIDKLSLSLADTIIAVSPAVALSAPRIVQKRITIIPNGINHEKLLMSAHHTRKELGYSDDLFIIGTVGRFVPVKNYDLLITCFAQLHKNYPNTHLLLIGSGPLETALRAQVNSQELDHVVSFIINQPAQEYYPLFDCFVQPSKNEGLSIALLEALAWALPVIVTGLNKQHSVIQDTQNGFVITPDNTQELYSALEKIYASATLRNSLGAAGKQCVAEQYSLQHMARQYQNIFNTMRKT